MRDKLLRKLIRAISINQHTYAVPPVISSVDIDLGDPAGGDVRMLTGENFTGEPVTATVTDSAAVARNATCVVLSATEMLIITPVGAVGAATIAVSGPGGVSNTLAFEYWSPASLAFTGHWDRGNYQDTTAGTWPGLASAGSSAGRDLTQSTAANQPAEVNLEPDLNGTTNMLVTAVDAFTYLSASAYTMAVLFCADTAAAPNAQRYREPPFFTDVDNGYQSFSFSTDGVTLGHYSAAQGFQGLTKAASVGALHLAVARYNGTHMLLEVDGVAATPLVAGNTSDPGNSGMRSGKSAFGSTYFDGRLRTLAVSNTSLSDANVAKLLKWARASRGLA